FTFSNLRRVAVGTAAFFRQNHTPMDTPVLIGYDRRFLSLPFAQCVASCLELQGFQVSLSKTPLPTPALSVSVVHHKAPWGIMITASHNPAIYNGYKLKEASGRSAPPEITRQIEQRIPSHDPFPANFAIKESFSEFDYLKPYEAYLRKRLDWKEL